MNVSLADLNLTIKAYSSVNLMDKKHYSYTLSQLETSLKSGSLFKKRNKIVPRTVPPEIIKNNLPISYDTFIPSRERSILSIKEEKYEELNVSDEAFAEDSIETAVLDAEPLFVKKEKTNAS